MNKPEFIKLVAEKATITKKEAEDTLAVILDTIGEVLQSGDSVQFVGFGTFEVTERKGRTCVHPKTKEKIEVSARKLPRLKVGKLLKDLVN